MSFPPLVKRYWSVSPSTQSGSVGDERGGRLGHSEGSTAGRQG